MRSPTGCRETVRNEGRAPRYEIAMREIEQKLHRDLPATTVWGYDGQFPGPTIEAEQGEPIYVRWANDLPDEHLLPEDTTIHSDLIPYDTPGVRTVTHLHGGNVESESDGHAQAWFTRDFQQTGPEFEKKDYYYVNDQPPATLWYHDHSLGITRLNVYAGLAGFYLLRSDHERSLSLPEGEYEIPLVLQDRSFEEDGSLFYPTAISDEQGGSDESYPDPSIVPQFYGDTSVVNGRPGRASPSNPDRIGSGSSTGRIADTIPSNSASTTSRRARLVGMDRRSSRSGTTAASSRRRSRSAIASSSVLASAPTSSSTSPNTPARRCCSTTTRPLSIAAGRVWRTTTSFRSPRSCSWT